MELFKKYEYNLTITVKNINFAKKEKKCLKINY